MPLETRKPPAMSRGFPVLSCCSANHGQKLRCTRKIPDQTSSDDGAYKPAERPPAPAKESRVRPASWLVSTFTYTTSTPISRFGTGFQVVREPTPHHLKSGLQPARPATLLNATGLAPARLRTGVFAPEQNIAVAALLKSTT